MKVIIAGSRHIHHDVRSNYNHVLSIFDKFEEDYGEITAVVSGAAKGVDTIGEEIAKNKGLDLIRYPAQWEKYGKRAGHVRNKAMAELADAAILIWDGESKGTKNMMDNMKKQNKPFIIDVFTPQPYNVYFHQSNGTIKIINLNEG